MLAAAAFYYLITSDSIKTLPLIYFPSFACVRYYFMLQKDGTQQTVLVGFELTITSIMFTPTKKSIV